MKNIVLNIKWISLCQKHFHVIFKGGALCVCVCVCVCVCARVCAGIYTCQFQNPGDSNLFVSLVGLDIGRWGGGMYMLLAN